VKHGGGKVMVWGCFRGNKMGKLYWVKDIMNKEVYANILRFQFLSSAKKLAEPFSHLANIIVQQDNDPKHSLHLCQSKFQCYFPRTMHWVPQSPDMSPIEPLWDELERHVRRRKENPTSKEHLFTMLKEKWEKMPPEIPEKLVESMTQRVQALIQSKGHHTKY